MSSKKSIPTTPTTKDLLHDIIKKCGPEDINIKKELYSYIGNSGLENANKNVQMNTTETKKITTSLMSPEQIIQLLLILTGIGFSAYNVYQSFQIKKAKRRQNLYGISACILFIFVLLLLFFGIQMYGRS